MKLALANDWDVSVSNVVSGTIYFEDEEFTFPCPDYSDFPIICVSSWVDTIKELIASQQSHKSFDGQFLFYDGPYAVMIHLPSSSSDVEMLFYNALSIEKDGIKGDGKPMAKRNIDPMQLIEMMSCASKCIIEIANQQHIEISAFKRKVESVFAFAKQ